MAEGVRIKGTLIVVLAAIAGCGDGVLSGLPGDAAMLADTASAEDAQRLPDAGEITPDLGVVVADVGSPDGAAQADSGPADAGGNPDALLPVDLGGSADVLSVPDVADPDVGIPDVAVIPDIGGSPDVALPPDAGVADVGVDATIQTSSTCDWIGAVATTPNVADHGRPKNPIGIAVVGSGTLTVSGKDLSARETGFEIVSKPSYDAVGGWVLRATFGAQSGSGSTFSQQVSGVPAGHLVGVRACNGNGCSAVAVPLAAGACVYCTYHTGAASGTRYNVQIYGERESARDTFVMFGGNQFFSSRMAYFDFEVAEYCNSEALALPFVEADDSGQDVNGSAVRTAIIVADSTAGVSPKSHLSIIAKQWGGASGDASSVMASGTMGIGNFTFNRNKLMHEVMHAFNLGHESNNVPDTGNVCPMCDGRRARHEDFYRMQFTVYLPNDPGFDLHRSKWKSMMAAGLVGHTERGQNYRYGIYHTSPTNCFQMVDCSYNTDYLEMIAAHTIQREISATVSHPVQSNTRVPEVTLFAKGANGDATQTTIEYAPWANDDVILAYVLDDKFGGTLRWYVGGSERIDLRNNWHPNVSNFCQSGQTLEGIWATYTDEDSQSGQSQTLTLRCQGTFFYNACQDLQTIISTAIASGSYDARGDLDGSGAVNSLDQDLFNANQLTGASFSGNGDNYSYCYSWLSTP